MHTIFVCMHTKVRDHRTFVIPPSAIISSAASALVRCAECRAYLSSRAHII